MTWTRKDGRYRLGAKETWYYENGQKQWEVTYQCGRKTDTKIYWSRDGSKQGQKQYQEDGSLIWTIWGIDGKIKAKSRWREGKLLNYEIISQ